MRKLVSSVGAAALAVSLAACGGGSKPENGPTEAVSKKIVEFTGDHSKLVWSRHVGGGTSDVHLSYSKHQLWGIDTRDGKGIRQLLETTNNYARPLISPDGKTILFTNKGTKDEGKDKEGKSLKSFNPAIFRTDWTSGKATKLADGYAVDIWNDPQTGIDWVFAAQLTQTNRASLYADKLERFQLENPEVRELVWDKTELSTENIQLSQDGRRASALFPWPNAGVLDLENRESQVNNHGCWPSLAPDNSYRAWVFDGEHKNLRMFDANGEKKEKINLSDAPGIEGSEVYHPRWSNHVSFMTMTGPYKGITVTKSNSKIVEIYIGRFNKDVDEVADWLQVTENEESDFFPDLWIADGVADTTYTSEEAAKPAPKKKKRRDWPVTTGRLLFLWENRTTDNIADKGGRVSSVQAREQARFGRHFDMLCDGGWFEADTATSDAVNGHLGLNRFKFTIEVLATPSSTEQDGAILSTKAFQIQQRGDDLILVSTRPAPTASWFGKAEAGVPVHLGVIFDGLEYQIFHNGTPVNQEGQNHQPEMLAAHAGLTFGESWDGAIEGVSIVPGVLDEFRVERGAKYLLAKLEDRKPLPRVRLKGKLLKMTADRPVVALDDYRGALLAYLYEVEQVLEGEYDEKQVLVWHWTILDQVPLQSFPRRPGQTYELLLEPADEASHPEIVSDRKWNDLLELLDEWYDVATPQD